MIHNFMSGFVELGGQVGFGDRHADPVGKTLPERTGGYFHTGSQAILGVAGGFAAPLAESF